MEREWAARQDEKSQENDIQDASPLLWVLPAEWWDKKPKLRQSPSGHPWCQPPGLYAEEGPKGARTNRIIAKAFMRDHAGVGRRTCKWTPALSSGENYDIPSENDEDDDNTGQNCPSSEPRTKRGFDMNISNAGRKHWYGGAPIDGNQ